MYIAVGVHGQKFSIRQMYCKTCEAVKTTILYKTRNRIRNARSITAPTILLRLAVEHHGRRVQIDPQDPSVWYTRNPHLQIVRRYSEKFRKINVSNVFVASLKTWQEYEKIKGQNKFSPTLSLALFYLQPSGSGWGGVPCTKVSILLPENP